MALDLSRVGKRDQLKVTSEPHWQRLRAGCFLGYRPSKRQHCAPQVIAKNAPMGDKAARQ